MMVDPDSLNFRMIREKALHWATEITPLIIECLPQNRSESLFELAIHVLYDVATLKSILVEEAAW